jgi:hypothetical protein
MVDKIVINKSGSYSLANKARGLYVVKFTSEKGNVNKALSIDYIFN